MFHEKRLLLYNIVRIHFINILFTPHKIKSIITYYMNLIYISHCTNIQRFDIDIFITCNEYIYSYQKYLFI